MKKKNLLKGLAVTLCGSILLSSCSLLPSKSSKFTEANNATSAVETEDTARRTIPYSEMEYVRPDGDAIKAQYVELTEKIKNAQSFEELITLDDQSNDVSTTFSTMRTLAMLKNYHDSEDTYYEEEYRYCSDLGVELSNLINDLNRAIIEGPFAEQYREKYGDYVYEDMKNSLLLNSDEVAPLKQQRNQLNIDYNNALSTLSGIDADGNEYTMEDLPTSVTTQAEYNAYLEAIDGLYRGNAETFANYYIDMIKLDKEIAAKLGFESVADMYYLSYSRDYTPADALAYCEDAKEIFVPLAAQVNNVVTAPTSMDLDKTLEKMPDALAKVDPYFEEVWQEMIKYGVYDMEALPSKQSGIGFTTQLYEYDTPFIYTYWDDSFDSATTVMHEFGHFTDGWYHYDDTIVFNLDIAETYSQGLELLMNKDFGQFGVNAKNAQKSHLQSFMNPLTYQAMLEEFQQRIYAMDTEELSSESIAALYPEVLAEYGLSDYGIPSDDGGDYSWFRVTHLFDSPFYTISYWTSACVALQIWDMSQDDYNGAVQVYANLMQSDQNQPFTQLIANAGLQSPGDVATLQSIADSYRKFFDLSSSNAMPTAA